MWEFERDCLFDTRIIHAGSPGRATQHISYRYQNALNTSAREKVKKYKATAEERHATFRPLIVTVEGILPTSPCRPSSGALLLGSRQSGRSLSQRSPTGWVRVRVQLALIKAVDLQTRGSRKKWRSSGF